MQPQNSPHLDLGVLEALGHKVDGLVGLVLVGLHTRLLRFKGTALRLVGQSVLSDNDRSITLNFIDTESAFQDTQMQLNVQCTVKPIGNL